VSLAELGQAAIASVAGAIVGRSGEEPEGEGISADDVDAPCFAVHVARVQVDPESGVVDLRRYYTAQDVGRALNRLHCEGQIQGGVVFGMGYGMTEELLSDNGSTTNANLWEYLLPTAPHVPEIDLDMIEIPSQHGPFGAKGVGETSNLSVAPAVANALADAVGIRVTDAPLSPQRVRAAIHARRPDLRLAD
jgi:CO/xanthine dehydrogenase Mo-binding subunit